MGPRTVTTSPVRAISAGVLGVNLVENCVIVLCFVSFFMRFSWSITSLLRDCLRALLAVPSIRMATIDVTNQQHLTPD